MKKYPMSPTRYRLARCLFVTGGGVLALGILLLIVKFVIALAYAAWAIAAVGLLMFLIGALLLKP